MVHSAWSHSAMAKKGLIITTAVKSKEEHGYVMDCGVNGLRSFLKEEKAVSYCRTFNGGRPLGKLNVENAFILFCYTKMKPY